MRAAYDYVGLVQIGLGCGGAAATPAVTAGAPLATEGQEAADEDPPGPAAYGRGYGGCAQERIVSELQRDMPEGTEPPEAEVAERVKVKVKECRDLVEDLTLEQFAWLQACTSCGGSCDVYRCMNGVPEDASEPFECDSGEPEPPAEDEDE
jgi:hypothetical protein